MNKIIIKGRLTKDPELRQTGSGVSVCNITVAVDRAYSKEDKQTDFFDCVFWRQDAEFVSKYFTKGREILVEGEMQSRKYEDKDGNKRTAWEIGNAHAEFCGSKNSGEGGGTYSQSGPASTAEEFAPISEEDGEPPF